jgi:hypothetical protein
MKIKYFLLKLIPWIIALVTIMMLWPIGNFFSSKIIEHKKYPTKSEIIFSINLAPYNHHTRALEDHKGRRRPREDLYYTSYVANDAIKATGIQRAVVFQGDSWMEMIDTFSKPSKAFFDNGIDIVINGGTSSYAPSAMEVQFNDIRKSGKLKIEVVVALIDQTDVMDEACRYNKARVEDDNGKLIALLKEREPDFYNGTLFSFRSIAESYNSTFFGLIVNQIGQKVIIPKLLSSFSNSFCTWADISKYMEGRATGEEILIFQKNLDSLLRNYS